MNTPEKCPKCGVSDVCVHDDLKIYACGTLVNAYGRFFHTGTCQAFAESRKPLDAERDQLATELQTLRTANAALVERVKRLEEVADIMANAYEEILCDNHDARILENYRKVRSEKG